MTKIIGPKHV